MFGGDEHLLDLNGDGVKESCGGQSEAPLWLGSQAAGSRYVAWAIRYGMSLGLPASKLSAEAIVGDFEDLIGNGERGFWRPIIVLKQIFDELGIPQARRTYPLSLYEHRKCSTLPYWLPITCSDEDPHAWADATLRAVVATVGEGARITAPEYSDHTPVDPSWPTEKAVESLGVLMQHHNINGGGFWLWVLTGGSDMGDPTLADPVVIRGTGFRYSPVQRELADLYGFHLAEVPNGSFEAGTAGWTLTGTGITRTAPLGQPDLPWRGTRYVRLTATGTARLTSAPIRVSETTRYTTTANLRFAWKRPARSTPGAGPRSTSRSAT